MAADSLDCLVGHAGPCEDLSVVVNQNILDEAGAAPQAAEPRGFLHRSGYVEFETNLYRPTCFIVLPHRSTVSHIATLTAAGVNRRSILDACCVCVLLADRTGVFLLAIATGPRSSSLFSAPPRSSPPHPTSNARATNHTFPIDPFFFMF